MPQGLEDRDDLRYRCHSLPDCNHSADYLHREQKEGA
jgi:hypothetical protein